MRIRRMIMAVNAPRDNRGIGIKPTTFRSALEQDGPVPQGIIASETTPA